MPVKMAPENTCIYLDVHHNKGLATFEAVDELTCFITVVFSILFFVKKNAT